MRGLVVIACFSARGFIVRCVAVTGMVVRLCAGALHGFVVPCSHAQRRRHGRHALDRERDRDYDCEQPKKL